MFKSDDLVSSLKVWFRIFISFQKLRHASGIAEDVDEAKKLLTSLHELEETAKSLKRENIECTQKKELWMMNATLHGKVILYLLLF